jgi:hypothetical protein
MLCSLQGFGGKCESGEGTKVGNRLLSQSKIYDVALTQQQQLVEERVHLHPHLPGYVRGYTAYWTVALRA